MSGKVVTILPYLPDLPIGSHFRFNDSDEEYYIVADKSVGGNHCSNCYFFKNGEYSPQCASLICAGEDRSDGEDVHAVHLINMLRETR